jgi:multicomponent Na+:H+ antiporter subunit G
MTTHIPVVLAVVLLVAGTGFFVAGSVGLIRFPDVYTRLHALAKADALGLGFVVAGLCMLSGSWATRIQLVTIWLLVLAATATVAHLLARAALADDVPMVIGADDREEA